MTSPFYNDDISLTLAGYAELQRLVLGYCNDKGYTPWRFNFERDNAPDAVAQWRQELLVSGTSNSGRFRSIVGIRMSELRQRNVSTNVSI
jgi:hypothetical protein